MWWYGYPWYGFGYGYGFGWRRGFGRGWGRGWGRGACRWAWFNPYFYGANPYLYWYYPYPYGGAYWNSLQQSPKKEEEK